MKHLEETKKLLDHIQQNPEATQRELVEKLNISLGKVNYLINALGEKGIIELKRFKGSKKKFGYLYLITPKGFAEKAKIAKDFLIRKIKEYEKLRKEIEELKTEARKNYYDEDIWNEKDK